VKTICFCSFILGRGSSQNATIGKLNYHNKPYLTSLIHIKIKIRSGTLLLLQMNKSYDASNEEINHFNKSRLKQPHTTVQEAACNTHRSLPRHIESRNIAT